MRHVQNVTALQVVRGSLASGLATILDATASGTELEQPARDAIAAFTEIERFIDQAGVRLIDFLNEPGRLPSDVLVGPSVEIVDLGQVAPSPLPPALSEAVRSAERQTRAALRTVAMSLALLAHRLLTELGEAICSAEPGPERECAGATHDELITLARAAGMGDDVRDPFSLVWPRVVGRVVQVELPQHALSRRVAS